MVESLRIMPIIHYKFPDGYTEEIEVMDEVAGLEWKDIDFEKSEITVCRSASTVNGF